jgi:GTP cyclohydrolase I
MPKEDLNCSNSGNKLPRAPNANKKHTKDGHSSDFLELIKSFEGLISYLKRYNDLTIAEELNFEDSAVRAAKAFRDMNLSRTEIDKELEKILEVDFPRDIHEDVEPGLIVQGPITVYSTCPHHLLPVISKVYAAYLPVQGGNVLGLSKVARIAILLGKRPILQEQLANDIANVLYKTKKSEWKGIVSNGAGVMITSKHLCMSCRGVMSNALTSVTELRGAFFKSEMELKFYNAIQRIAESRDS